MGLAFEGVVATRRGAITEGARLLDEAMARTVGGERSMPATGVVYCRLLSSCLALQDFRRAGEWTDVVDRCGHATGMGGFPGDCRAHRASVLIKRGDWARGMASDAAVRSDGCPFAAAAHEMPRAAQ
jgi:hypothetical protein